MSNNEAKLEAFYDSSLRFSKLLEIALRPSYDEREDRYLCSVIVTLGPADEEDGQTPFDILQLSFASVQGLRLTQGSVPFRVTPLEIIDVSDRQMEDLNFLVSDSEGEVVRFYCENFEATIESRQQHA